MIERILSHQQSKLLSAEQAASVSAAGWTMGGTTGQSGPGENTVDVGWDW